MGEEAVRARQPDGDARRIVLTIRRGVLGQVSCT